MKKPSDQYLKLVQWSEEDGCYVGTCPGLMLGGVHGGDETAVFADLCRVVDEWLEIYERDGAPLPPATAGKTFSGNFRLRVPPELHQLLAAEAATRGDSLNQVIVDVLEQELRTAAPAKVPARPRPLSRVNRRLATSAGVKVPRSPAEPAAAKRVKPSPPGRRKKRP